MPPGLLRRFVPAIQTSDETKNQKYWSMRKHHRGALPAPTPSGFPPTTRGNDATGVGEHPLFSAVCHVGAVREPPLQGWVYAIFSTV